MRRTVLIIAPFIVILSAWAAASRADVFSAALQSLFNVLPYVFALFALSLSIGYQNGNSFFLSCFILFSYVFFIALSKTPEKLSDAVTLISILFPVNAIWLGFSRERGIFSYYGRNKALILFGQVLWIVIRVFANSAGISSQTDNMGIIRIKAPAMALYVVSIFILLLNYILQKRYMNLVFMVVLLASFIALHFANRVIILSIFTTAMFTIVVIALLDISYSLAFYDALTGVLSRRAFEQEILKHENNYAIAMVDLDHFKHINDKYGHDVGDEVLKMVASTLKENAGGAKIFRYGGEEFIVLFAGMSYNDIRVHLDNMRKAVEKRTFFVGDKSPSVKKSVNDNLKSRSSETIKVTVSIGAACKTGNLKNIYDVIKKADEALYKSKNNGRNCITMT